MAFPWLACLVRWWWIRSYLERKFWSQWCTTGKSTSYFLHKWKTRCYCHKCKHAKHGVSVTQNCPDTAPYQYFQNLATATRRCANKTQTRTATLLKSVVLRRSLRSINVNALTEHIHILGATHIALNRTKLCFIAIVGCTGAPVKRSTMVGPVLSGSATRTMSEK